MRRFVKLSLFLPFVLFLLVVSANAQITSISQIKDVKPTDKHYQALQSLVERYGVYSETTFRATAPLTREDFMVLLNRSLNQLIDMASATNEDIAPYELFTRLSANETNITSTSQIKDIKATYAHYVDLRSLTERYGIDICDKDKNFRPNQPVTEKEFYTWMSKIFKASFNSTPSAPKPMTRSEWVISMNNALDSVTEKISTLNAEKTAEKQGKEQAAAIKGLSAKGKAKIVKYLQSYAPGNTCTDFTQASKELKLAAKNGGIWNGYKIKNEDVGDIVFETTNTCKKGKLVLLRIGTAIVTMSEEGIIRLK